MKRSISECPRFRETGLKDSGGSPVVDCAICAFGKARGAICTFPKVDHRWDEEAKEVDEILGNLFK